MSYSFALRSATVAVIALLQGGPAIPAPRGLVNDFAGVIPAASAARIERIAQDVRDKTRGEMAIVTLTDLGGRDKSEIALRIGREWKVGNLADIGNKSRNAGVVILVVPKETATDKVGRCRIETGQGAEGFITDATAGDICREATPLFKQQDYGSAIELITLRVAQRYAQEFNVSLDTAFQPPAVPISPRQPAGQRSGRSLGISPFFLLVILFIVLNLFGGRGGRGGRSGCFPWWLPFLSVFGGGGRGGGWGGGGFGGGGGGGGFGGFGGGGGFSGGGGGSDW